VCDFTSAIPFWWEKLLESTTYKNGLKCRWEELRQGPLHTDSINYFINSMSNYLQEGRIRNFEKWPIIGVYVNWNSFVGNTYEEDLNFLKTYIEDRSIWIDNNITGICDLAVEKKELIPEYSKIWPNPMNDYGYIGFTLFDAGEISLEIIDIAGRKIKTENFGFKKQGEHAKEIDLSTFSEGNYIYILKNSGRQFATGKVIVR
jgi:hypothetical protein